MFYLDKDELEEAESGSRLFGANYEIRLGADDSTTLGATYMKWMADAAVRPGRDGLNVFNLRAYTAPVPDLPELAFEFEYATERNGDALQADAWTLQGSYELSDVSWTADVHVSLRVLRRRRSADRSRTKTSIRCSSGSTTGARGGRVKSPASISSRTAT